MKNLNDHHFVSLNIGNSNITLASSANPDFLISEDLVNNLNSFLMLEKTCYFLLCSVISMEQFQSRYPEIYQILHDFKHKYTSRFLDFSLKKNSHSFLGMPTAYSSSLGNDRLTQSYLMWKKLNQAKKNYGFILDAGTMSTVDIIHQQKGHLGGYILPGIKAYSEIFSISKQLPSNNTLINSLKQSPKTDFNDTLPLNTVTAITSGYWKAITLLILDLYQKYSPENIIISGGHSNFWYESIDKLNISKKCHIENNPLFPHLAMWQIGNDMLA